MNGGAALVPPPDCPPVTSIAWNSLSVTSRTLRVGISVVSSIRLSEISRGLPPVNCGLGKLVPVTLSYFHSLDFEIEYSVGLK